MLQGHDVDTKEGLKSLLDKALEHSTAMIATEHKEEFLKHMNVERVKDLHLDDSKVIGYTMKCVGSGFWALKSEQDFKDTLLQLVREGGDADTNGAVAGSLLGCRLGFSELPKEWLIELPNKRWLDKKVVQCFKHILK